MGNEQGCVCVCVRKDGFMSHMYYKKLKYKSKIKISHPALVEFY